MSTQAKPTLIGAFVSGALLLLVASLFVLGNGRWFSDQQEFIIYFPESVNGLAVGAPVKFRGVKIGEVKRILIHYNQPEDNLAIPVIITVDYTRLQKQYTSTPQQKLDENAFVKYVREGLRAKLEFQSFVTGMLFVELDYYDDTPPKPIQLSPVYPEIPALGSTTNDLMKSMTQTIRNISEIDFKRIAGNLNSVLENLDAGLKDFQFKVINDRLVSLLSRADNGLAEIDFKGINVKVMGALQSAENFLNDPQLKGAVTSLHRTLGTADEAFAALRDMLRPDSALNYQLDNALSEMASAAQAFRQFADFLDRNPSALLTGRASPNPALYGPQKQQNQSKDEVNGTPETPQK